MPSHPQIDLKQLAGILNSDDSNEVIAQNHHKMAFNGRFRGLNGNMRFESVPGTIKIPNSALPTGNNECIGSFYDGLKQRLIWFNFNSEGKNGIYQYSLASPQTITPLFICFTNSQTDILGFSLDFPIASINILYTTDTDGDIIHWVARNNRPMKLNIKDALANTYGSNWLEEYLTVARPQITIPPVCSYTNDATKNINNLRKKLFEFRVRPIYKDFTKGTWSAWSKIPSPANPDSIATDIDPTKNNRIDITIQTGNGDCTSLEIAARESISSNAQNTEPTTANFSDPYSIITLDKAILSIPNNSVYTYQFFNDGAYLPIDIDENNLEWDRVPYRANTQELLNGNVIIYGGITEGYDFGETLNVTSSITTIDNTSNIGLTIFLVSQTQRLDYYFSGGVTNVVSVTLKFTANAIGGITNGSVTYVLNPGDTIINVVNGLFVQFPIAGTFANFAAILETPTQLAVFAIDHVTSHLTFISGSFLINTSGSSPTDISIATYHPRYRYTFVLIYMDDFGVSDGAHLQASTMSLLMPEETTTGGLASKIPQITFNIFHQPPIWATRFSWGRTVNLTAIRTYPIVSYTTQKDANYGYLEITPYQTNSNNFPIYDFIVGDRVRILGEFVANNAGTVNALDFPIVDLVTNPVINNSTKTGVFVKVPFNSSLNNFGTGHNNWFIEIYTPAPNTVTDQQVYYEFAETYPVLQAGTDQRAHGGQQQDQIFGTQPAIYNFLRGDFYQRSRLYITGSGNVSSVVSVIDSSVSDLYPSRVQSIGRPFQIDQFAVRTFFGTMVRWSLQYEQNTSINQTNRFFPLNFDESDRAKGAIQRLNVRDRILRVYQSRGVGSYGIYSKFIQNNSGQSNLVTTNDIITKNNINYYIGEYGMGEQYCSLTSASIASRDYFVDPVRGYHIRVSNDGMVALNELYKGQFYIRGLLIPYNQTILRTNGSVSKILGCYDYLEEQPMIFLQGSDTIEPKSFSFNEKRTSYCSFYEDIINGLNPEWITCAEDTLYSWKNGDLYIHNDDGDNRTFYGVPFYPSLTLVFNTQMPIKKVFNAISYQSNQIFVSDTLGDINTSMVNPQTNLQQISKLVEKDYEVQENIRYSSFLKDANSMTNQRLALWEGDVLNGNWIECKLIYKGSKFGWLFSPYISWQQSPRNL